MLTQLLLMLVAQSDHAKKTSESLDNSIAKTISFWFFCFCFVDRQNTDPMPLLYIFIFSSIFFPSIYRVYCQSCLCLTLSRALSNFRQNLNIIYLGVIKSSLASYFFLIGKQFLYIVGLYKDEYAIARTTESVACRRNDERWTMKIMCVCTWL